MKAITLAPEWGHAVAHFGKNIENRTWWPPKRYTGDLAIHSRQRFNPVAAEFIAARGFKLPERDELPTSTVVAVVAVIGHHDSRLCEGSCSPWAMDTPDDEKPMYHWELADVRLTTHIPLTGQLGWWDLPPAVDIAIHAQLMARADR